jgi:hypothetical protein
MDKAQALRKNAIHDLALRLCKIQTKTAQVEEGGLRRCYCERFEKEIAKTFNTLATDQEGK